MRPFRGATIALLEARMSDEIAEMIRRYGGVPYSVPAVREAVQDNRQLVGRFLDQLAAGAIHIVVFQTGVGATLLAQEADQLGRKPDLIDGLAQTVVVCRGPKPTGALRRMGIASDYGVAEPYTTADLLNTLAGLDIAHKQVAIVQYGERNEQLLQSLRERQAQIVDLCLYTWEMPADITPLQALIHAIIDRHVNAVVFTTQVQARHLMRIAEDLHLAGQLLDALKDYVFVASIGPTCTNVLCSYGISPHVAPRHPKMGHLIKALHEYMQ
jgi:uroporphyrinogen-III synthase